MTNKQIRSLELRIAKEVMQWKKKDGAWWSKATLDHSEFQKWLDEWFPWDDAADALEVLKRLARGGESYGFGVLWSHCTRDWKAFISNYDEHIEAFAPGDHYGPAVCRLAEKILNLHNEETT